MSDEPAAAYVGHAVPGRLRLKIPSRRGDEQYFDRLKNTLGQCPGIHNVEVHALTSSALIAHGCDHESISRFGLEQGLFNLFGGEEGPPLMQELFSRTGMVGDTVSAIVGQRVDLMASAFVALVGLALFQTLRGNVLAPAVTLLWYAVGAAMWGQMRKENGQ